jgi:hypothetical protein
MGGNPGRKTAVVLLLSAALIAGIQSCATLGTPLFDVAGLPLAQPFWRAAAGGGLVTVNTAVQPGSVVSWNSPPAAATTYALIDNNGENNKREKRYDLRKNTEAYYSLVLSADPNSTRTRWQIFEVTGKKDSTLHRSGHLWPCDNYEHMPKTREFGFRDCTVPIPYDPRETNSTGAAAMEPGGLFHFASSIKSEDSELLIQDAPVWISCTTGCCSLGQ